MVEAIRTLPGQFTQGWSMAENAAQQLSSHASTGRFDRVVVCGLGGSAFPGELVTLFYPTLDLSVCRDYLPYGRPFDEKTLVIASSFSGNTEETLSSFRAALDGPATVSVVTAGGKLATEAAAADCPTVGLSRPWPSFQPRAASGFFVGAMARLIEAAGLATGGHAKFEALEGHLSALTDLESRAEGIAERLQGRIPVIYAPTQYARPVAQIAKIKINENSKMACFWSAVPEMNHNEMVGYTRLNGPFTAVLLDDPDGLPRMQHRIATTAATLTENGVPVERITLSGPTPEAKAFSALFLFDFVSCVLALAAGIDPNPVAMVEDFKARLGPFGA